MACKRLGQIALVLSLLSGWGCNGANICGVHTEAVQRADGGSYSCTIAEDCPRPANVFVCLTTGTPAKECVGCNDFRCERTIPEECK